MRMHLRAEDGFTLTELTVVVGLLSVLLAVAYLGFDVVQKGSAQSDRMAYISQSIGAPLDYMERIFIQQYGFDSAGVGTTAYRASVYTDRDNDGHPEHYIFEATSAGTLVVTSSEEVDRPTASSYTLSDHNTNVSSGHPLFHYYDANRVEITNMGNVASQARSMTMTVVTTYDGDTFSDTRRVFFRNR